MPCGPLDDLLWACLVMVSRIEPHHRAFSEGLRARYGRVPTAGLPRITRLRAGLDLFGLFDPAGNWLIFLQPPEEGDGAWVTDYPAGQSALRTALDMAALFRDYKGNDDSVAAKILDVALARDGKAAAAAPPLDRALVLAARAEIAVALGEAERANALRAELCSVRLSDAEREECRIELEAADELERWAVGP